MKQTCWSVSARFDSLAAWILFMESPHDNRLLVLLSAALPGTLSQQDLSGTT